MNIIDADGRAAVRIRTDAPSSIVALLKSIGRSAVNVSDGALETYLSPEEVLIVASAPNVISIRAVETMAPRVVSQGRSVHNAVNWHSVGLTGAGVRVGVIDSFGGILGKLGTELPSTVVARCYTSIATFSSNVAACDQGSVHGTGVAETIVDMAPGVELYVANPLSRGDFRQTVNWMVASGVSIINFSAAYTWDGPGDGTSLESDSPLRGVDDAVAGGALFVSAAGNEGRATWLGPWWDADGDGLAQFNSPADSEANAIRVTAGERIAVQLRWDDSWAAAARDIDLWLYSSSGGAPVAYSLLPQDGTAGDTPSEFFSYIAPATGYYYIRLTRHSGSAPSWVQLQAYTSQDLQYYTSGSIGNPAESANPGMLAAGAAWWNTPATIESFSSQGPTPDGRIKPDIVGADGADTASYGPGAFFGTSQATSHVVGLAALVKQRFPAYSPAMLASYLKSAALPRGASPSNTWGFGFASLPGFGLEPRNLSATVKGTLVSFTWLPPPGVSAMGYSLEAGSGPGLTDLAVIQLGPTAGFAVSAPNGTYFLRVRALTAAGWSRPSNEIVVTVVPTPPTAPLNLQPLVQGSTVSFSWQPGAGDAPAHYQFEAGSAPGLSNLAVLPWEATAIDIFGVPPGAYFVRVRAVYASGTSAPSNEVHVVVAPPAPPGPPANLTGAALGSSVTLQWQAPVSGGAATSYTILAGSAPGLADVAVVAAGMSTALSATGVGAGTYHVRIVASNTAGQSAPSNEIVLVVSP